jgi:hypothetical protein
MLWKKASNGQLVANRENAKKSTGPRTEEGRAKVSQNRTIHGLTGAFHVLPGENAAGFDELMNQLMLDEKPVGIAEVELVKKMAEHTWCAERAGRFMDACFLVVAQTPEQLADNQAEIRVRPELERYIRYQAHHNREYARASAELLKRRKERRDIEIGFESQQHRAADEQRRENRESRHLERHKTAAAIDEQKLEREIILTERLKHAKSAPVAA